MSEFSGLCLCLCPKDAGLAPELSEFLAHLPRVSHESECPAEIPYILWLSREGLAVGNRDSGPKHATRVDFSDPALLHRLRTSGKRQGIGKAVGLDKASGQVSVIDATAGLGRDALVLAHLGCEVTMLERSPLVHALLADGLQRAATVDIPQVREAASRMQLVQADARHYLAHLIDTGSPKPDVIILDPMFPLRQKTALVKKAMNMLQQLLGPDQDLEQVLAIAKQCAVRRVVVKRPPAQPDIAGPAPSFTLTGKGAHFAVYVNSSFSSTPR